MTTGIEKELEELQPLPPKPGKSKVETIKEDSKGLRGTIAKELEDDKPGFSSDNVQLLKFHGMYQQEDRDFRKNLRQEIGASVRTEKAHSFMIRTKVPGGILTADQYLAHDDIGSEYANGTIRITTRQDIQFHGVLKGNVRKSLKALNDRLVTTIGACGDIERNVMFCPVPERDPVRRELLGRSLELSNRLLPTTGAYAEIWLDGEKAVEIPEPDPIYGTTYMPRKFKSGMAFPGDNCIDVYSQDLGIVPEVRDDVILGYNVLIGGGLGMTHRNESTFPRLASPVAFVPPGDLLDACLAVVTIQRDYGNRKDRKLARLKYVVEEWGVPRFRAEMARRVGKRLEEARAITWEDAYDHLGWSVQGDGNLYLGVYVENGRVLDNGKMRMKTGFRRLVEELRPGVALTAQQNILFTDIPPAKRDRVNEILSDHGIPFVEDLSNAIRYSMACPAMPTCGLAIAEAERALPSLIREIEAELASQGLAEEVLSVRMTGCPNGCARPYIGDVGIVGRSLNQYVIYLGGDFEGTRLNQEYADLVSGEQVVPLLRPVFALFKAQRQEGESFGNFCNRLGVERIRELAGAPA
jgi:sulfite reductase (ferredoxin)